MRFNIRVSSDTFFINWLLTMTLLTSINRADALVQELTSRNTDVDMHTLLSALGKELKTLRTSIEHDQVSISSPQVPLKTEYGCYIFNDDKQYYCPLCYDNTNTKVATQRINSKLRVCPACRSSIKSP